MGRVIVVLVGLLLTACSTKTVVVPEVHYRDSVRLVVKSDSIYLHDSIYTYVRTQGDTVYVTKDKVRYQYIERLRHDTLTVLRTDTITKVVVESSKTSKIGWVHILAVIAVGTVIAIWIRDKG